MIPTLRIVGRFGFYFERPDLKYLRCLFALPPRCHDKSFKVDQIPGMTCVLLDTEPHAQNPNMPATNQTETVATSRKSLRESNPLRARQGAGQLRVPAVRHSRASSCPRCPQGTATQPGCKRKTRSSSSSTAAAPATQPARARAASGYQRELRAANAHSSTAFIVISPDPKKRKDIQRKAEAELAALEELRLTQAMAYVSISPSSVGGSLSLAEVRLKQQQEMMQAKPKKKLVRP